MFVQWKKIAASLSIAALLGVSPAMTSAVEHSHGHSHDATEPARLTLNNGKKWATDANLRQGMSQIRDALAANLHAIHSGKATPKQYRALAQKINDQIAFMIKNCKLGTKADAMLHLVLADIIAGADAMMGQDGSKAHKGAGKIADALKSYAVYFDHPGWHELE